MKLLTALTLGLATTTLAFSQTTMCYKENHNSMTTIESVKLDGGECNSQFSLKQMKKQGWSVDDIKMTPKDNSYSFIYILKKNQTNINNYALSNEELEKNIIKRLDKRNEKKKEALKVERKSQLSAKGKQLYTTQCASCHGKQGEESAYNSSKPLNTLSYSDMQFAIERYTHDDDYGNGNQMIMRQYAPGLTIDKIKAIYVYLQSINKSAKK
mgnify:CR=1 FL=1